MIEPITPSVLASRLERQITRKPLRSARHLADLDRMLERKPELVYERNVRNELLAAFERLGRCSHCGREIRKESSVRNGVGDVCRKRIVEAERRREALA